MVLGVNKDCFGEPKSHQVLSQKYLNPVISRSQIDAYMLISDDCLAIDYPGMRFNLTTKTFIRVM